jgi:hypothetical protein
MLHRVETDGDWRAERRWCDDDGGTRNAIRQRSYVLRAKNLSETRTARRGTGIAAPAAVVIQQLNDFRGQRQEAKFVALAAQRGVGLRTPPRSDSQQPAAKPVPSPLQLEMRVRFDPTAFPNGGRMHLLYELLLTNFATSPLYMSRVEVLDADGGRRGAGCHPRAEQLAGIFQPLAARHLPARTAVSQFPMAERSSFLCTFHSTAALIFRTNWFIA